MPATRVEWQQAWRIISARYPPIDLFERLTGDPAVWEALIALEQLTNPRIRQEVGKVSLVPPHERVSGAGASYVMASFTHLNPLGSRFSNGTYGIYYAASKIETAIAETVYHFEAFARAAHDPVRTEATSVLVGAIDAEFENVGALLEPRRSQVLDPTSYEASQAFAKELKAVGSNGVIYPSVRRQGGECIGAFRPNAVSIPHQERQLQYRWSGHRVDRYFDFSLGRWIDL
jgi:RES domain-containing protein